MAGEPPTWTPRVLEGRPSEFHFLIDSLCPWADPTELTGVPCQIDYDLWGKEMKEEEDEKRKGAKDTETLCTAVPLDGEEELERSLWRSFLRLWFLIWTGEYR